MATEFKLSYTGSEINEKLGKIDSLAAKSEIPTKVSELTNDSGYITSIPNEYITETELNAKGYLTEHQDLSEYALKSEIPSAPVQSVNGQTGDVNLSASDVGAIPDTTIIPTKTSELTNDSCFATETYVNTELEQKMDASELTSAVDNALAQAKASGEFKGEDGNGIASTVLNEDYTLTLNFDDGTSYTTPSIRGATGVAGTTPEKYVDYFTDSDKEEFLNDVDAVRYVAQSLTPEQQEQARENIGALSSDVVKKTEQTVAPYTNMLDRYGYVPRSQVNQYGAIIEASWDVWSTNYIPIRKGQILRVKFNNGYIPNPSTIRWALYDENKTISTTYNLGFYINGIIGNSVMGTMTVNGSYIVWDTSTITYGGWNNFAYARLMLESIDCVITIDEEITEDVEFIYELKPTFKVPKENLLFDVAEKPLVGKKVVCFGDSLFGRTRDDSSALYQMAQITGANVENVGFGGTCAAKVGSNAFAQFSLPALTDAIISGTWTSQDSNVSAATGWNEQLPKLKAINFSVVDIIILHYGTNDFMSAYTLDGNDITSVCGGLRYSIEKLLARYPQLKFYISLPVYRYWGSEGAYVYPDTYTNTNGVKLTDFIEGIRKVAAEYNFPVIDGFYGMGINKFNASHYLADQTHHNVAGMKLFGEFIAAQITSQQSSAKSGMDTEAVQNMIDAAIAAIPVYNGEVV